MARRNAVTPLNSIDQEAKRLIRHLRSRMLGAGQHRPQSSDPRNGIRGCD